MGDKAGDGDDADVVAGSDTDYIRLKVVGGNAEDLFYRVKTTTKMLKLKISYSERCGVPVASLRFLFDGKRINDDDTPEQLEMEKDDENLIEVFQAQMGGNTLTP